MSFSPLRQLGIASVALRLAPVALVALVAFGALAACDNETQAPRGAAYPEPVGYDSPDQTPPPSAPPQMAQQQQLPVGAPVGEGEGEGEMMPTAGGAGDEYADTDPSALTDFRSALEPYGAWGDDPTYGNVWVPSSDVVGDDFTPYVTGGHWAYGDDYVWMSDYDWGWAPFHYGRWTYLSSRSAWGWIPGRTYSGGWVTWRSGYDGYVGWAAMPPTWGWRGGAAVGIGAVPPAAYTFTTTGNLFAPQLTGHTLQGPIVAQVAAHTQPFVPAHPGVSTLAHPSVSGPVPTTQLHLPASAVAHLPDGDRGVLRAQQFSHASSAQLAGGHAPSGTFTAAGRRYAGHYGNYTGRFAGGAVAGHALVRPAPGSSYGSSYGRQFGTTRIGAGSYGSGGAYSYGGARSGGSMGGYYRGGSSFHGGSSFSGGVPGQGAPSPSHYYGTTGAYTGGGGHSGGGGHGGGGHGGGHR